ncbi:hypothetical protein H4R18_005663, partial [Coemansia javaensis]
PLVPTELYALCVEAGGISRPAALEALETIPPARLNVLVYLLAFLREAVDRGAALPHHVAAVFAPALLRPPADQPLPPEDQSLPPEDRAAAEAFLLFLLEPDRAP